jgi:hypothetical protein
MPEWVAAWEKVFNFGADEAPCDGLRNGVINNSYALANIDLCFGWRERREELDNWFKALIPEFRRKYYLNKSPRTTDEVRLAIHIRRGDVPACESHRKYTSNGKILRIADGVKSILETGATPFNVRIYGQGKIADFPELSPLGAEFFLDVDPVWTMEELVEADILIVAKSCFSFYAGLVSGGIKIFEPCSFPSMDNMSYTAPHAGEAFSGLDDWLPCQEDGSVDRVAFDRQLDLLLQAKRRAGKGEPAQRGG